MRQVHGIVWYSLQVDVIHVTSGKTGNGNAVGTRREMAAVCYTIQEELKSLCALLANNKIQINLQNFAFYKTGQNFQQLVVYGQLNVTKAAVVSLITFLAQFYNISNESLVKKRVTTCIITT